MKDHQCVEFDQNQVIIIASLFYTGRINNDRLELNKITILGLGPKLSNDEIRDKPKHPKLK